MLPWAVQHFVKQNAYFSDSMVRFELGSGVLIAVPVPEDGTVDIKLLEEAVDAAIAEAR